LTSTRAAFLEGFYLTESRGFEEWMLLMQERLQRRVKTGLQQLVDYCLANGLYQRASATPTGWSR
jgi:hypothetical protein